MNYSRYRLWQKYRIIALLLALLLLVAYGGSVFTPSLLGDEWGVLNAYINDQGPQCPAWQTPRPFGHCWLWVVYHIVGPNIYADHAAAVLVSFLSSILLLILLEQILPNRTFFNSAVVVTFLVFPADMTRTWLAGNIVYAIALFLVAACFFAAFWRYSRWCIWIVGMLLLCVAIGTYEVPIGLIIFMSVSAFVWARSQSWFQRLVLLAPALVAFLFSIWRWLWQLSAGSAYGYSTDYVYFSPTVLISRLIYGYRVNLQWAWTDALLSLLPPLSLSDRVSRIVAVFILAGMVLVSMLIISLVTRSWSRLSQINEWDVETQYKIKDLARIAIGGLLVLGVGYIPGILVYFPGMDYTSSRTHHLPSIGAAVFICAILFGVARLLTSNLRHSKMVALAGLVPLLVLGIASQLLVQQHVNRAWADQKQVWHSLFELAPDITEGTNVVFILTGYEGDSPGPGPFISGPWGMSAALNILYGKNELYGDFAYGSSSEILIIDGEELVVLSGSERRFSAAETLVFVFDKASRQLTHLQTLETSERVISLGADRILNNTPTQKVDYRWLVQD